MSVEITIVICTYNNARLLAKTLESLEQQVAPDSVRWSVLVIDNNCTDDTPSVIERFVQRGNLPELRRVIEPRQGTGYARLRGVAEADSPWLAFVDDDCLLDPHWLVEALRFCRRQPNCGAVGGRIDLAWEAQPTADALRHQKAYAHQDYGSKPVCNPSINRRLHLVTAGLTVNREAVFRSQWREKMTLTGRTDKSMMAGEDLEMLLRIVHAGYEVWYNPAMHLQHVIPARRMEVDYLCRLHRGLGEADAFLRCLAAERTPSFSKRFLWFLSRATYYARRLVARWYHDFMLRRPVGAQRLISVHEAYGQLRSAFQCLWTVPRR